MSNWEPSKDIDWQEKAECAKKGNRDLDFFSSDSRIKNQAKNMCFVCPVRQQCLKWALENGQLWGIWGGRDYYEIRHTLSVNSDNMETRYERFPKCLSCGVGTKHLRAMVVENPEGGRWTTVRLVTCTVCDFTWRSRTSANAVNAFFKLTSDKRHEIEIQEEENERLEEMGIFPIDEEEDLD